MTLSTQARACFQGKSAHYCPYLPRQQLLKPGRPPRTPQYAVSEWCTISHAISIILPVSILFDTTQLHNFDSAH